jgi:hypothetical protein
LKESTATMPVLELDPFAQALAQVSGHRPGHLGEVGLEDPVCRVLQSVGEVTVVGEQEQALGVGVEPTDVEEPFLPVAEEVADGRRPNSSLIVDTTPNGLLNAR